ncbi:MAG: hypothetical protein GY929_21075 [Actinomycetia bacterium]|nr:hypothetical protein [Actinomycetes bacterium]
MRVVVVVALGLLVVGRPAVRPRALMDGDGRASVAIGGEVPPRWFVGELARCLPDVGAEGVWRGARWVWVLPVGAGLFGGLPAAVVVLVATSGALAGGWWFTRGRAAARLEAQLPALIDDLGRASRAGFSIGSALQTISAPVPLAADLGLIAAELQRGLSTRQALDRWRQRRPLPSVVLVCTALTLAEGAGGSRSRALAAVSDTLRERRELAAEVRALASQGRASAAVLVIAPVLFAVAGSALDDRLAQFLFASPGGWACLAGGVGLDGVGAFWMARLVKDSHAI